MLASRYWVKFYDAFYDVQRLPKLTHIRHLLTRLVYGILLLDDRIPAPSILSPFQPYSHPKAGVCVYRRKRQDSQDYVDVKIGELTYVFERGFCMSP